MDNRGTSKSRIEWGFILTLLVVISFAFALIIEPFFGAIVWAVVVAVLFRPVYDRLLGAFPGRTNLVTVTTLVLILLLVIVPAILLGFAMVQEATGIYQRIQAGDIDFDAVFGRFERSLPHWMQVQLAAYGYGDFASIRAEVEQYVSAILEFLLGQIHSVGQGAFQFMLGLGVMLYLTFFLLRDGPALNDRIGEMIPLEESKRHILMERFLAVIRATIKGSLVIAVIQGTLGGLVFWALDIRGALLWGVVMGVSARHGRCHTGSHIDPVRRVRDQHGRQCGAPDSGRAGHKDARLCGADHYAGRAAIVRYQRHHHRPAGGGAVHRHLEHFFRYARCT